ncbi:hypothetical protein HF313_26115 [Massilia atriviolacea]|uniref:ABC transmembrane type-1 domain-containing protein n=1 Tax=Massilia atriviolacea TaxID=2495579 RepID=A0A430HMZ0_9BURK|nr:ABC transporter transmembrane domain-containing protein [Massilia atriviolacea]RSZ58859.1 hypothetical protein EJB06_10980 [Massilia atriviolacea]
MKHTGVSKASFFWGLQGICTLHRKPYSPEIAQQQLAAPYSIDSLASAITSFGFKAGVASAKAAKLHKESFPLPVFLRDRRDESGSAPDAACVVALVLQADRDSVLVVEADDSAPRTIPLADFGERFLGKIVRVSPQSTDANDPDSEELARQSRRFGFSWFVPELLKHKKLCQEVLLASLVIQLIALATPLCTQAIIDKVVVHHSQSTLIVIAIGMAVFMLFSAALSWMRQYLVLHTGNRVDAALGASVFARLFKLPPMYFQHRPAGVIAARLHGVETIFR